MYIENDLKDFYVRKIYPKLATKRQCMFLFTNVRIIPVNLGQIA